MEKFMVMFQRLVGERYGLTFTDPFLSDSRDDARRHSDGVEFPQDAALKTLYVFDPASNIWFPI